MGKEISNPAPFDAMSRFTDDRVKFKLSDPKPLIDILW